MRIRRFPDYYGILLLCGVGAGCAETVARRGELSATDNAAVVDPRELGGRELFSDAVAVGAPAEQDEPAVALQARFDIWRFCLSGSYLSGSDQLWDHVDESIANNERGRQLRRNGIRLAVGSFSSWPAIRALLLSRGPQVWSDSVAAVGGQPISIDVGEITTDDPLFYYDVRGRLRGARYPSGTMSFKVTHLLDLGDLSCVYLQLVPEIRRPKSALAVQLERSSGGFLRQDAQRFSELAMTLQLEPGDYLVVGPNRQAQLPHLIGSRLLWTPAEDGGCENLYCLVPKVFRRNVSSEERGQSTLQGLNDERGQR